MTLARLLAQVAMVAMRDADEAAWPTPDVHDNLEEPDVNRANELRRHAGRVLDEAYGLGFDGDAFEDDATRAA